MSEKLEQKYIVTKTDGTPAEGTYFVLNLTATRQWQRSASRRAFEFYIDMIEVRDPAFAEECRKLLEATRDEMDM